ncbi:unnamed protein product [Bursaphelenchus xylophilus]|uniref:(pine wood nematode) hypothetical protein n=1 Tax=Bursaphelenchus xylophilus TaxID=6326 RepID=A0A1I7SV70_BURXY|nr:unnamed protein product [Bursaphelenchus xylophilus]CAG9100989.1 unnamed protein product [Bursaphelenchus xylophilus]
MKIVFWSIFIQIACLFWQIKGQIECGRPGGDFNRTRLILQEAECVRKYTPQQCWVYGVKPQIMRANALITFKLLPNLVSPFTGCIVEKMSQMKPDFLMNFNYTSLDVHKDNCITKAQACHFLKDYLVPMTCLIRRDCNKVLSDALYAFQYGDLMLAVETTKTLKCYNSTQFDIQSNFFNLFTLANGLNVVPPALCSGIELPIDADEEEDPEEMEDYADDRRKKGKKKEKPE